MDEKSLILMAEALRQVPDKQQEMLALILLGMAEGMKAAEAMKEKETA